MSFGETFEATNLFVLRIGRKRALPLRLSISKMQFNDTLFQELLSSLRDLLPQHLHLDPFTGTFTTRYVAEKKPCHHKSDLLQFIFYFTETVPKFSLFLPCPPLVDLESEVEFSEDSEVSLETYLRQQKLEEKKQDEDKQKEEKRGVFVSEVIKPEPKEVDAPTTPPPKTEAKWLGPPITDIPFSEIEVTQHTLVVEVVPSNVAPPEFRKGDIQQQQQQHAISHYFSSQTLPKNDKTLKRHGKNKVVAKKRKASEKAITFNSNKKRK